MKKLVLSKMTLCCLPAFLFLFSCSPDVPVASSAPSEGTSSNTFASRSENDVLPFNRYNPFDEAGAVHTELISAYYAQGNLPNSIEGIAALVHATVQGNLAFQNLGSYSLQTPDPTQLHYLLTQQQQGGLDALVACAALTPTAKASFKDFLRMVQSKVSQNMETEAFCKLIIDYEAAVMDSKSFIVTDKEILLITSSITRHSVYFRKKRPKKNTDPDWDWLTLHIAGAATGADESAAEAVALSLACGIVENR